MYKITRFYSNVATRNVIKMYECSDHFEQVDLRKPRTWFTASDIIKFM